MKIKFFSIFHKGVDYWLAYLFFIVALVSRYIFQDKILFHWDSVQFALAIEKFNPALHQPQPPGYILFVALGKFLNLFLHNPTSSLIWLSTIFAALSAALLYLLATRMFNRPVGIITGIIYLTSPLAWLYGEIAFSYIVEFFFSILTIYLLFTFLQKKKFTWLILGTLSLSFALGIRQNAFIYLLPVYITVILLGRRNISLKQFLINIAVLIVSIGAWFIPLVFYSGGWQKYWQINTLITNYNLDRSIFGHNVNLSGKKALVFYSQNILKFSWAFLFLYSFPIILYLIYFLESISGKKLVDQYIAWRSRILIILSWLVPSLIISIVLVNYQPGNMFGFLAILMILSGLATLWLFGELGRLMTKIKFLAKFAHQKIAFLLLLIFLAISSGFNIYIFLKAPLKVLWGSIVYPQMYPAITSHQLMIKETVATLRQKFDPKKDIILFPVAYWTYSFRHFQYYLPEFDVYQLQTDDLVLKINPKLKYWHAKDSKTDFVEFVPRDQKRYSVLMVFPKQDFQRWWGFAPESEGVKYWETPSKIKIYYWENPEYK
jgi:4-amino-4-deoxy-L-arabinose transferase-like glycosyltransferase